MNRKPVVAIVGRPNVGKSALFNDIAGSEISIVDDRPGVTRDRIYADCTWLNYQFTLIDTGGIEPESTEVIPAQMREQAEIAIETADVIVLVVDGKTGLMDDDSRVMDILRRSKKPVVLCVNKIDNYKKEQNAIYEFYSLGTGDPFPVSAANRQGLGELLDEICAHFPENLGQEEDDDRPRIAIVGRPNVGKSSIVNRLVGENRVIVSDIAGTTRDAIDTPFTRNGQEYVLIDTAGLRRKSRISENIERFSIIRTVTAVDRADVVVLVIDATAGVTEQDAKIAGIAHDRGKGILIAVNKWDAYAEKDDKSVYKFSEEVRRTLSYLDYADIIFISAKTGQRMDRMFDEIDRIIQSANLRVGTGVLNEVLARALTAQQPPSDKGHRLRVYYMTQVSVKPPTFAVFVNDKELMHFSYTRYLENQIREAFGFRGTPLRFLIRERRGEEET
ncbi:MAG: ribosome biogenesis GTPase Der [Lachnospiraceae bacterium]